MKVKKNKLVCASCGGENVNDERIISLRINCEILIGDQHLDFYCEDCEDITELVWKHDYNA